MSLKESYRELARALLANTPGATVTEDAYVSPSEDGAFVECVVWVPRKEAPMKMIDAVSVSDTIYVVFGDAGEYSEREEWLVKAFKAEDRAKAFVADLEAWLLEKGINFRRNEYIPLEKYQDVHNPLDPNMSCDYTGVRYFYAPVTLEP